MVLERLEKENITHQQKKLNEEELLQFKTNFDIPLTDEECVAPFLRPQEKSDELSI